MSCINSNILAGASGSAGGGPPYVDDVFSTYLWKGNNGALTINNGIDLAGEGGLVWLKQRTSPGEAHTWIDTERGQTKVIMSNYTYGNFTSGATQDLTSFNSNGFSLGPNFNYVKNSLTKDNVSWTFRKAPGFFDVVTYTGTGSARTVAHNLGSVPGMIIVKKTSGSDSWQVWHRSMSTGNLSSNDLLKLDQAGGKVNRNSYIGTANSSTFEVGTDGGVNTSGATYVAYIFAHDEPVFGADEDESIIKCGTFTTSSSKATVNLGFEPQWVMFKGYSGSSPGNGWEIYNSMTGLAHGSYTRLSANDSGAEVSGAVPVCSATATGFEIENTNNTTNFIYMAIRRPNKPPELATEVFAVATGNSSNPIPAFVSNFTVDAAFLFNFNGGYDNYLLSRLTGDAYLRANTNEAQVTGTGETFDSNTGWARIYNSTYQSVMFKRAPGFMDVVTYTGSTTLTQNVAHNLGVVPEMMIIKNRDASANWVVYHAGIGATEFIRLNTDQVTSSSGGLAWNDTAPTASVFTLGNNGWDGTNYNGQKFLAYLFATLPGISKVGSYSGTGNAINVPCGFTNGARFILIKRINGTGDWYLWDSLRGIVSGNDPYLLLNVNTTQTTNTDYVDPLSTGFTVTSSAPAALNTSGGTYLFLAIA